MDDDNEDEEKFDLIEDFLEQVSNSYVAATLLVKILSGLLDELDFIKVLVLKIVTNYNIYDGLEQEFERVRLLFLSIESQIVPASNKANRLQKMSKTRYLEVEELRRLLSIELDGFDYKVYELVKLYKHFMSLLQVEDYKVEEEIFALKEEQSMLMLWDMRKLAGNIHPTKGLRKTIGTVLSLCF